jgi:hypothetical protein
MINRSPVLRGIGEFFWPEIWRYQIKVLILQRDSGMSRP